MHSIMEPTFLNAGLYLCYMNYHATGEGVTSCIAVAGSEQEAERLIKDRLPEYFHCGLVTTPIDDQIADKAVRMLERVPSTVRKALGESPRGAGHYFSEFHYNLS